MEGKTSAGHIFIWNGGTSIILLQHNGLSELLIYWCLQTFSVNYISYITLHYILHNMSVPLEMEGYTLKFLTVLCRSKIQFPNQMWTLLFASFFFKYLRQNVNSPKNDVNIDDHKHASSKCFYLWNTTGQDVCLRFYCLMFGVMCFGACINEYN